MAQPAAFLRAGGIIFERLRSAVMAPEQWLAGNPGDDSGGSDIELAEELFLTVLHAGQKIPAEAIAALFCRALLSEQACFLPAEQRFNASWPWIELFARADAQRRLICSHADSGDQNPNGLAQPITVGEQIVGFVGVAGRDGGYDLPSVRRFAGLVSLLAGTLQVSGRDCHAAPEGCVDSRVEVSGQISAQEKLRLHARIFARNSEAVLVTDASENVISSNRAFANITGYRDSDILGQSSSMLLRPEGRSLLRSRICDDLVGDGEWCGELQLVRKNGESFSAWTAIGSLSDAQGRRSNYFLIFSDITARKEAEHQIHRLAHYDSLTALPNRRLFYSLFEKALSAAQRKRSHGALLFLDLNRFKNVNESFGHTQADLVLQEVSRRLALALRDEDIVARLGGDEFVIALPEISRRDHAGHVARKVLAVLAEPFFLEHHEILLSASIGISIFPEDGRDTETLLKNADVAMFRAKKRGSNSHVFYSQEMNQRSFEQLKLEGSLRRASERGEFHLLYQPQFDLASGRITGAEALLRWQHPEHGLIPPAQFIPVAEETGLINQIGEWVLDATCSQIRKWLDQGLSPIRVAVNLSARQFSASLPKKVVSFLSRHAIPSDCLELEITESMLMHSTDSVVAMMREFGEAGVLMTLDDFGTGYSSLSYLKRFPIDNLKIDQSFVRGIPGDPDDSAIARAIISMAHNLRLSVIAEGVETAAQMEFLRGAGCEEVQGYYFSRPLPPSEFGELLLSTNR